MLSTLQCIGSIVTSPKQTRAKRGMTGVMHQWLVDILLPAYKRGRYRREMIFGPPWQFDNLTQQKSCKTWDSYERGTLWGSAKMFF